MCDFIDLAIICSTLSHSRSRSDRVGAESYAKCNTRELVRQLEKKSKKNLYTSCLRTFAKLRSASLYRSIKAFFIKIQIKTTIQIQSLCGKGERIKRVQNPQSNYSCTWSPSASDTDSAIIYQISKQMTVLITFIEYTKCSYLFPCGKNIIL